MEALTTTDQCQQAKKIERVMTKRWSRHQSFASGSPPNHKGVYIIFKQLRQGTYLPFYVGRGCSIRNRINHHRSSWSRIIEDIRDINKRLKDEWLFTTKFTTTYVTDKVECRRIEAYLFDELDPLLNTNRPSARPIAVNLPFGPDQIEPADAYRPYLGRST